MTSVKITRTKGPITLNTIHGILNFGENTSIVTVLVNGAKAFDVINDNGNIYLHQSGHVVQIIDPIDAVQLFTEQRYGSAYKLYRSAFVTALALANGYTNPREYIEDIVHVDVEDWIGLEHPKESIFNNSIITKAYVGKHGFLIVWKNIPAYVDGKKIWTASRIIIPMGAKIVNEKKIISRMEKELGDLARMLPLDSYEKKKKYIETITKYAKALISEYLESIGFTPL
jgi:hypothetical protein